jgi:hypothetical protein
MNQQYRVKKVSLNRNMHKTCKEFIGWQKGNLLGAHRSLTWIPKNSVFMSSLFKVTLQSITTLRPRTRRADYISIVLWFDCACSNSCFFEMIQYFAQTDPDILNSSNPPSLASRVAEITDMHPCAHWELMANVNQGRAWGLNLGLSACKAGVLQLESSLFVFKSFVC